MRKFKYSGESQHVGRFGAVKHGQVLSLTEEEAYYVQGDTTFTPMREVPLPGFPEEPGLPAKGGHYNLQSLRWKSRGVFKDVRGMRRARLTLVLSQLEASGFPVPVFGPLEEVAVLRDYILMIGRKARWI